MKLTELVPEEKGEEARLHSPEVNYFGPEKGPFRCGHCHFFNAEKNFCENNSVKATVDAHGCCNLYEPRKEA